MFSPIDKSSERRVAKLREADLPTMWDAQVFGRAVYFARLCGMLDAAETTPLPPKPYPVLRNHLEEKVGVPITTNRRQKEILRMAYRLGREMGVFWKSGSGKRLYE